MCRVPPTPVARPAHDAQPKMEGLARILAMPAHNHEYGTYIGFIVEVLVDGPTTAIGLW